MAGKRGNGEGSIYKRKRDGRMGGCIHHRLDRDR